jgi:glycosyltransferase involved in cell wall biosynthesis
MGTRKYVTAFAGARDSYQVPLALEQDGQLDCLITDLYLPPIPAALKVRLGKLARRSAPGLPVWKTRSSPGVLWRSYIGWRLSSDRAQEQLLGLGWSQDRLSRLAGQRAARRGADLFLYAGYALKAFENPRLAQARRILYMYHPHIERSSEILSHDMLRYPEAEAALATLNADRIDRSVDRELAMADLVVCSSEFTASTIQAIGIDRSKVVVIPYGIDVPAIAPPPKATDTCHFLFVGSGIHRKGLHTLCEAWKKARLLDARLTLVCRYVEPWIRDRLNVAGITLRPGVTPDELGSLYQDAHVFVLPALVEGFAYVYLEALARGCFCIGTENTGLPDLQLTQQEALIIPAGEVDALADALSTVFIEWKAGRLNPTHIRRSVEPWSWARFRRSISACARQLESRKAK